jgi:hypothetical protein
MLYENVFFIMDKIRYYLCPKIAIFRDIQTLRGEIEGLICP